MDNPIPDANTETESSPAPETAVPSDDKPQTEASSATAPNTTVGNEKPIAETLADIVQRTQAAASKAETDEAESGDVQSLDTTEGKEAEAAVDPEKEKDAEKPPPFHDHPAWKRVVGERDKARTEATEAKELATAQEQTVAFCKANQIQPEQFREALDLVALINTDPVKAFEKISAVHAELSKFAGKTLPKDLQDRVDASDLKVEDAEEIARLRAEKVVERSRTAKVAGVNHEQLEAQMVQTLNVWKDGKAKADPDFNRKATLVSDRFQALLGTLKDGKPAFPIRTPEDAAKLADRAYADVNAQLKSFAPAPQKRRVLTANGASGKNVAAEQPKTLNEAIARGLKDKHGITMVTNGR